MQVMEKDTEIRRDGARVRVRPLGATVHVSQTTAEALDVMDDEGMDFVPITSADNGKLLGVVLRRAVERGCLGMGHRAETCIIQNHLKTGIPFCFESEQPDLEMRSAASKGPVVVVDATLVPVGVLEME